MKTNISIFICIAFIITYAIFCFLVKLWLGVILGFLFLIIFLVFTFGKSSKKNMEKKKIYFGHPVSSYSTELEEALIEKIKKAFPEYEIENPNQPHHQTGYDDWQEKNGNGMNYFYNEVLPFCDAGIFLPFKRDDKFEDCKFGAGVASEVEILEKKGCKVFEITPKGDICPLKLKKERILTISETRKKIRTKEGKIKSYYGEKRKVPYYSPYHNNEPCNPIFCPICYFKPEIKRILRPCCPDCHTNLENYKCPDCKEEFEKFFQKPKNPEK